MSDNYLNKSNMSNNNSLISLLKVLIVDDVEYIRNALSKILELLGVDKIYTATNGEEAIDILKANEVNLIISDLNMPIMNGLELLSYVKSDSHYAGVYFVLSSTNGDKSILSKALDMGVDDFIVKPFQSTTIQLKLNKLITRPSRQKKEQIDNTATALQSDDRESDHNSTILIVDDSPPNIRIIKEILQSEYIINVATSGKKALEIAQSDSKPDLILLDIMMPEMDGYAVCQHLKENQATEFIPVIFLSSNAEVYNAAKGFELGAVDYIAKPVSPIILQTRVANQLRINQVQIELNHQLEGLMEHTKLLEDVDIMLKYNLKKPLQSILETSDSILASSHLEDKYHQQHLHIRGAACTLLDMVNRFHDIHKIESGTCKLNLTKVDIAKVVQSVIDESQSFASEQHISIQFANTLSPIVIGEELLCFSIINNLVKNAIEASPFQGVVTIKLEESFKVVTIHIHNQGMIPSQIRNDLFNKISTYGKTNGTGIGTYSAKLMATIQDGGITFDSDEKNGTSMYITLPAD